MGILCCVFENWGVFMDVVLDGCWVVENEVGGVVVVGLNWVILRYL